MKISIKAARVNADMTQDDVAKAIGKSKQTIVNWERGTTSIKYNDMVALSELYQIPLDNLDVNKH